MMRSSIVVFLAVVALPFVPIATAFACGPCIDPCCLAAQVGQPKSVPQLTSFVAVLPAQEPTSHDVVCLDVEPVTGLAAPSEPPLHAPLRI